MTSFLWFNFGLTTTHHQTMNKSSFFTGQPIFSQLIKLIDRGMVDRISRELQADRYCKKFNSWHHLITMLYSVFQHCTSLREVTTGMLACEGRLQNCWVHHFPKRSTLSDANAKRDPKVFEKIFMELLRKVGPSLPDSRLSKAILQRLIIIDSTTISLFSEIFKAAGRNPSDGKRKGGVKVHMAVQADKDLPCLVSITSAATNDNLFTKGMRLTKGSYVVFDKGFHSHQQLNDFAKEGVWWVTRQRNNTIVRVLRSSHINKNDSMNGVINDEEIVMGHNNKIIPKVKCRRITFRDKVHNRDFQFITNNTRIKATTIDSIYKQRWQIELLFKRLKQNMPLQYFLGDNQNAIKIQIWCTLIADLLLHAITSGTRRKWAFSNLSSLIRLHLMNYTNLKEFLNNPEKARISMPITTEDYQLQLFSG